MRNSKFLILILCLPMLLVLQGCATTEGPRYDEDTAGPKSLDVAALLRLEDVPVPMGFRVIDNESFAFQNNATRVALLKYVGSKTADQVVLFYKDQMPMYNWSPINIIEYGRRLLNYEKDLESCIVTVESHGRKSIVTIAISPKSRPMKVEPKK